MSTTWSSPDPLTDNESLVSSPRRRAPNRRANTPLWKSAYERSARDSENSPAKQSFESHGGDAIRKKRTRRTVEAGQLHNHNHNTGNAYAEQRLSSSSSGAGGLSPTPYYSTPFRCSAMKVRTKTVPLRGLSDSEGEGPVLPVVTPKRGRGRPSKSTGTPVPSKVKRTSTPAVKVETGTKTRRLSDLLGGSSGDNSEEWDFNIPQNVTLRGRSESHGRAAPTAIPAEFERASSEVPMSSRANKRGRRIGIDGTPSAFGQSFKKARIGPSRLGRLDFEVKPGRREEYDRRSSESIVEPDVGFGPFDHSSRPSTEESGTARGMGSSPPGVGGQVAYPTLTQLRREGRERRQSVGYQEFSFALHEGEDYGQSSSVGSTGAESKQREEPVAKRISSVRSDSPKQQFEDEIEQARDQPPYAVTQQPSPLRTDSATPIPDNIPQSEDSPQQQYYDQDSHSDSLTPTLDDQPQREDPPPQQFLDQDSQSSSPAPSQHQPSSPHSQHSQHSQHFHHSHHTSHSDHSQQSAELPFPSLSPAHEQDVLPQTQDREYGDNDAFNEFDTIMENEDFTMITAETVPSLLQYFTSPLDPVEQAEIRAEIAAEEVELEEEARREEDEERERRRMRESGFMDIVHKTVERSVSRNVKVEVTEEGVDWSLTHSKREAPRSPPETQEVTHGQIVEEISFVDRQQTRSATREQVEDWSKAQSRREILRSPPLTQVQVVEEISLVEERQARSSEREASQSPTLEDTYEYTLKEARTEEEEVSLMQYRREIPRSPPPSQVQLVEQISTVYASLSRSTSRDINRGNDGVGDDGDAPMDDVEQDWSLAQPRREIPRSPPQTQEVAGDEVGNEEDEFEESLPRSLLAETAMSTRLENLHPPNMEADIVDLSGAFYPPAKKSIVDQEFKVLPTSRLRGAYLLQQDSSEKSSGREDDVVVEHAEKRTRPVLRGLLPNEAFTTQREIPRSPIPGMEIEEEQDRRLTQSKREIPRSPIPISAPSLEEPGISMEHMRQESELDDDQDEHDDGAETTTENTLDSTAQEEDLEMAEESQTQSTPRKSSPIKASGRGYVPSPSPPIRVLGKGYVPEPSPPAYRDYEAERDMSQQPAGAEKEQEISEWEEPPPAEEVMVPKSPPIRASGSGYVPSPTPPVQEEASKGEWDNIDEQRSEPFEAEEEHEQEAEREQSVSSDATERNTPIQDASQSFTKQAVVEEDAQSDDEDQQTSQHSSTTTRSSRHSNEPAIEDIVEAEAQPEPHSQVQQLRPSALLTPDETPSLSNMGAEEGAEEVEEEEEDVDIWALEVESYDQSRAHEDEDSAATIRQATFRSHRQDKAVQQPAETQVEVVEVVQNEGEVDQDVWMAEASAIDPETEDMAQPEIAPESETLSTTAPEPVVKSAPEPPTPGFKRSLQRSQVEIELEEVLQKAQKRRSGLPEDWLRQSRGSASESSLRGGGLDDSEAFDQTQTGQHHPSVLRMAMDGEVDERPSMIGDASMIRREQRHVEAELRRAEQEKEAERIKSLAASKEAERLKRREERELERRKRAEDLERELQREREEREARREAERKKRREEREKLRDEEINKEREEKFLQKQREEQLQREKEEAQYKADEERKAQEEAQRMADEQKREAEAQRQAELEAEREAERLMVEARRAAEREAQRVAELRKEREAAKQRRREERQAEREAELRKEDEERAKQRDDERRERERDKENVRFDQERAAKRRMLEPRAVSIERPRSGEKEPAQAQQRQRFPFSSIPTSARRLDTKVFIGDRETQSTSYMLLPLKASSSHQENDETNPFRMSGQGKRTFEPREALIKPQSAAAMPKPDFLFDPPTTRYTAPARAEVSVVDDFEFRAPTNSHLQTFAVSNNSRVRGARLGSFSDAFARPAPVLVAEGKEPEMEEVREMQPEPEPENMRRVMRSIEAAPPYSDRLYDEDQNMGDRDQDEDGSESDVFSDAANSVSVSLERSQSRSVSRSASRSAEVEQSESRSFSRSVSRSLSGRVTPTSEEVELTGALFARQRSVSQSASVESSSQASSEECEDEEDVVGDVGMEVNAEMEDAPSQSASPSPSITSQSSSSQSASPFGDEEEQNFDEQDNDNGKQEMREVDDGDEDEDEDPFSRFSDSENEIVASTPMPPRGILRPRQRLGKVDSQMQTQASPYRPQKRRERPQISDDEDADSHAGQSEDHKGSDEGVDEERQRQDRRSTSENRRSGYRTAGGVVPKSPLKSSFRHPPPSGSPKKAVVFSATTAVSPTSSFEDRSDETVRTVGEQALLEQLAEKESGEDESRSPSASPTPSTEGSVISAEGEEDNENVEVEQEEQEEDRSHLRRMTPFDWSKSHWKALLSIKNAYESSSEPREIPEWVRESPFVDETIWGGEEDGSMDLVVEEWMVDVARLFIEAQESDPVEDGEFGEWEGEDWKGEMEHVIKRVYGLVSVERKCARLGKDAPWEVVARKFQPVKKRTVERLNSRGEWVEVRERKGFFGLGMGWL